MGNGNAANPPSGNSGGIGGNENASGKASEKAGSKPDASASAGTGTGAGTGTPTGTGTGTETGKAGPGNNATVNPTSIAPDNYERDDAGNIVYKADGVTPRKKRGRKAGSVSAPANSAPKAKPAKTDTARAAIATEMLAAQFQILNTGIAYLTRFDDFKLEDDEAQSMAEATANVMAQFDYVPDPKVAAILGLVTTSSMIYGPRLYLYRKEIAKRTADKRESRIAAADERAAENGGGFNGGGFNGPLNMGQFSG